MSEQKTTVTAIYHSDYEKLKKLKRMRDTLPLKKPKGRGPALMESYAEVLHRIINWYIEYEVKVVT